MSLRTSLPALLMFLLGCGGASATQAKPTTPASVETVSISADATAADDTAKPSAAGGKAYPIHLHRPGRVGARSQIAIDQNEDDVVVIHDASGRKELGRKHVTEHVHLDGVWTTAAVDANQDETRVTIDVTKLTEGAAVLLKNKRIDVTKGATKEDAIVTVDGKPVSKKIREALQQLFSLRIDSATSDNALLGSAQLQHVGDRWPLRGAERARADLFAETGATSTDVSGEVTLVGIEHVGGVDALRLKAEIQIDGLVLPTHHAGETCDPTQGKTVGTFLYPLDERRGPLETHLSSVTTARIHVQGPRGQKASGDVDSVSQHEAQQTPL